MKNQNRIRLIDTEIRLMVAKGEGGWMIGEKNERIEDYKLVVTQ